MRRRWPAECSRLAAAPTAVVIVACAAVLLVGPGCNRPATGDSRPTTTVHVRQPLQRLGTVLVEEVRQRARKPPTARFTLENPTAATQEVVFAGTSCYCVRASHAGEVLTAGRKITLPPAGHETILLAADVAARRELQHFRAEFLAKASGAEDRRLDMSFSVPVLTELTFRPEAIIQQFTAAESSAVERELFIDHIVRGAKPVAEELVLEKLPARVEILAIQQQGQAKPLEADLWQHTWLTRLRIRPDLSLQGAAEPAALAVRIVAAGNTLASGRVPLVLRRSSGLDAPRHVHFGVTRPGERRQRKVLLSAADRLPFEVRSARANNPEVTAAFHALDAQRCWLELSYHALQAGKLHAEVVIETTHPACPRLTIEVFGTCATPELAKTKGA